MKLANSVPVKPVKKIEYDFRENENGVWKYHLNDKGCVYREFRSHVEVFDRPLISFVAGINPETEKIGQADGIIAIGQKAKGILAIGQFSQGYISIGQFAVGRVFAFGQFAVAPLAIGQMTIAVAAVSQFGLGMFGAFQVGFTVVGGVGQEIFSLL